MCQTFSLNRKSYYKLLNKGKLNQEKSADGKPDKSKPHKKETQIREKSNKGDTKQRKTNIRENKVTKLG